MGSDSSSSGARAKRHAGGNGPRRVHSVNLNRFVMIVGVRERVGGHVRGVVTSALRPVPLRPFTRPTSHSSHA